MVLASPNLYKTLRRADFSTMKLPFKIKLLGLDTSNVAGPKDIHPPTVFQYLIQGIHGCARGGSELDCSPYHTKEFEMAPLQGTPRYEPPTNESIGNFGEGCEILE